MSVTFSAAQYVQNGSAWLRAAPAFAPIPDAELNVANGNAGCVLQLLADALGQDAETFDPYCGSIPAATFGDGVAVITRLEALCLEEHKKPTTEDRQPGKCTVITFGRNLEQVRRYRDALVRIILDCVESKKDLTWG